MPLQQRLESAPKRREVKAISAEGIRLHAVGDISEGCHRHGPGAVPGLNQIGEGHLFSCPLVFRIIQKLEKRASSLRERLASGRVVDGGYVVLAKQGFKQIDCLAELRRLGRNGIRPCKLKSGQCIRHPPGLAVVLVFAWAFVHPPLRGIGESLSPPPSNWGFRWPLPRRVRGSSCLDAPVTV